ncbi:MAG: FkbM family methyltransferase [Bacteroidota bacterium]
MKVLCKQFLQSLLGFDFYLFVFAIFKIKTFRWDSKEKDFFHFLDMMDENSNVLDIGSNIGITTVHLSRKVKKGMVYSFEPLPPNFKTLKKIVRYFECPNVRLYDFAVGNEESEVEMVLPEVDKVQMQGLGHVVHEALPDFNEGKRYKTEIHKVDSLEFIHDKKIDGIKLDVENFEYFVLQGSRELLMRDKPVIYAELWENENRIQCFKLMTELGYDIKVCDNGNLVRFEQDKHSHQNFFFIAR